MSYPFLPVGYCCSSAEKGQVRTSTKNSGYLQGSEHARAQACYLRVLAPAESQAEKHYKVGWHTFIHAHMQVLMHVRRMRLDHQRRTSKHYPQPTTTVDDAHMSCFSQPKATPEPETAPCQCSCWDWCLAWREKLTPPAARRLCEMAWGCQG